MAFHYSPKTVTDGLVLYLDAANSKSYISGSTSWNDISRTQVTSSAAYAGYFPTYVSSNGGGFSFNNATVSLTSTAGFTLSQDVLRFGTADYTMEIALTVSRSYGSGYQGIITAGNNLTSGATGSYAGVFVRGGSGFINFFNGAAGVLSTSVPYTDGQPLIISFTKQGNTMNSYKNGALVGSNTTAGAFDATETNGNVVIGTIVNTTYVGQQTFVGTIYSIKVYNKLLSAREVLQNYNATKTRFGLT
jgi:hypothetical protein